MKQLSKKLALLLAVLALVAAACSSDDDDSAADATDAGDSAAEETSSDDGGDDGTADEAGLEGTLRVMIHQNPPMVAWVENFNDEFEAANPGVTIDLSVIDAADIPTANQTRLSAGDIDVTTVTVTGFANPVQPYMTDVEAPYWQQLIDAGLLMDLSGQDFINNYDDAAIAEGGSYDGGVYSLNLGRVSYSGMFVNLDLLDQGYAGVLIYEPNSFYRDLFEAAEDAAFAGDVGLWGVCGGPDVPLD